MMPVGRAGTADLGLVQLFHYSGSGWALRRFGRWSGRDFTPVLGMKMLRHSLFHDPAWGMWVGSRRGGRPFGRGEPGGHVDQVPAQRGAAGHGQALAGQGADPAGAYCG